MSFILSLSHPEADLANVGGKGASLRRLTQAGLPVPDGFHITTAAYRRFVEENNLGVEIVRSLGEVDLTVPSTLDAASQRIQAAFSRATIPPEIAGAIVRAYASLPGRDPAVAVRSSATAEDLPEASFAGQQETYLNVSHPEALLEAVKKCWASLWTARAIGYRIHQGISSEGVALAVVVQLLVPAEAAGILFTVDPVSGMRRRILINAAWGLGEAVVGGSVTPDTLVVDKTDWQVIERRTADKLVMTNRIDGSTAEEAVPENMRKAMVLDDKSALELAELGLQIETLYGMPMDIEWALVDGHFAILQARPITSLPSQPVEVPKEWRLPDPKGQYMRGSIIDFLPDPVSPLFESLALPMMGERLNQAVKRVLDIKDLVSSELFTTINGYAYVYSTELMRKIIPMMVKMVPALSKFVPLGEQHILEVLLPAFKEADARWRSRPLRDYSARELYDGVVEQFQLTADLVGTLQTSTAGAAGGTEMMFTAVHNRLVRRKDDPEAPVYLMGFDNLAIQAEKALFDLAGWCRSRVSLADYLKQTSAQELEKRWLELQAPQGVEQEDWDGFRSLLQDYLDEHGHSIYEMDFMKPLPAEEPAPILETLKMYLSQDGKSPYERQEEFTRRREQAIEKISGRTRGLKRKIWLKTLGWAQHLVSWREDGIAYIGQGYPLLKAQLRELGERMVKTGRLDEARDIYWLRKEEVQESLAALDQGLRLENMAEEIGQRKALWERRRQLTPPPTLPPKKRMLGINLEAFLPLTEEAQTGEAIKGLGASPGKVTGLARVLNGPEDFDQMRPGEVLVATNTTPAWTPLFAMAAAIVTDIGGPLSHGSIVAREYGIPAVLGTGVATRRIQSGRTITVDGSAGIVTLN